MDKLTIKQAAEVLGVPKKTLSNHLKAVPEALRSERGPRGAILLDRDALNHLRESMGMPIEPEPADRATAPTSAPNDRATAPDSQPVTAPPRQTDRATAPDEIEYTEVFADETEIKTEPVTAPPRQTDRATAPDNEQITEQLGNMSNSVNTALALYADQVREQNKHIAAQDEHIAAQDAHIAAQREEIDKLREENKKLLQAVENPARPVEIEKATQGSGFSAWWHNRPFLRFGK